MKKILIADDHNLFAIGLKEVFEAVEKLKVVSIVKSGKEVVEKVDLYKPDVLILDLNMKDTTGFKIMEELCLSKIKLITIVVTMYKDELLIKKAKALGANAYMLKESSVEELVETVLNVTKNDFYLTKALSNNIKAKIEDEKYTDDFESSQKLTRRELEILTMIATGNSTKTIAEKLYISPTTVNTHRKNMKKKLQLFKISELVGYAYKTNII
ncbi:MAG: response regulator transcription factor [Chlorobi bacterium]|nr:response regulator transcription factor [Chlorobiota bacterium]